MNMLYSILPLLLLLVAMTYSTDKTGLSITSAACDICKCSEGNSYVDCSYILIENTVPIFPQNTTTLILSHNRIVRIQKDFFKGLPLLENLDISYNKIIKFDVDCFDDIRHIKTLNLKGLNRFSEEKYPLPIAGLTKLRKLHIPGYNAPIPHAFSQLTHLTLLDLSEGELYEFVTSNLKSMKNLPIRTLNLSRCNLEKYDSNVTSLFPSLEVLDISCNLGFGGQNYETLMKDLSGSPLETLYALNIANTETNSLAIKTDDIYKSNLKNIILSCNQRYIRINMSSTMRRKLNYVFIGGINDATAIWDDYDTRPEFCQTMSRHSFMHFIDAETVTVEGEISANKCTFEHDDNLDDNDGDDDNYGGDDDDLNPDIITTEINKSLYDAVINGCCKPREIQFMGQKQLVRNMCSGCNVTNLRFLNVNFFSTNPTTGAEQLNNIYLKFLNDPMFEKVAETLCICIYAPTFRTWEMINIQTFWHIVFRLRLIGVQYIQRLVLDNINIKIISSWFLSSFSRLVHLSLANNRLGPLFENTRSSKLLYKNSRLEYLDMSGNQIKSLSRDTLINQINLRTLILKNNMITVWNMKMNNLTKLEKLDLSNNHIQVITDDNLKFMDSLNNSTFSLIINMNEIDCSCKALQFTSWIRMTKVNIRHKNNILCSDMKSAVIDLILDCQEKQNIYTIGITTSSLLIVLLLVFLAMCLRHKLRYKWHLMRWRYFRNRDRALPGVFPNEEDIFDLFVSYSSEDHDWVWNILRNKVTDMGFRVFIHEVHFPLGEPIADCIVHAIDICPCTLVILSDNFMTSEWCTFELNMALAKGYEYIIPIQLSDISQQNNTRLLRYIRKSMVYNEWSDDQRRQARFWERFEQALIRRVPPNDEGE